MHRRVLIIFTLLALLISSPAQGLLKEKLHGKGYKAPSPFDISLDALQKLIGYPFEHHELLRRAMTHSSYSQENNKALSILGGSLLETSVAIQLLTKNIDTSASDLNRRMLETTRVESCAADGLRLGLQKVVRVSSNTNSSSPTVICGAFRAIFGAIALDSNKSDVAGFVFWKVHRGELGQVLSM